MNRILYILFLVVWTFCLANPVCAQKSGKNVKKQRVAVADDIVPDQISMKARPDRHPKVLAMPNILGKALLSEGEHMHGIDVSHYQGRINWDEVAKDPKVGYVYLKATEGTSITDDTYRRNFQECKRVGLKVGSYLFFRPQYSAKAQFDLFVSMVDTKKQDLLPLIDAEAIKGVSIATFQQRLLELCKLFEEEYGVKPLIYTGQNFYNKNIHSNSHLREYKYFIAAYAFDEPELYGGEDYLMWQYTAHGSVRGIRGNVDQSRFVGRHGLREILYR